MHTTISISSQVRYIPYLGHFIFFLHFVFSILFVYEKALYADAANFIFNIVNQEDFFIAAGRYSCMLPQLLPILTIKLGASLKTVLLAYSVSYIFYYYLLFMVVVYILKNAQAGLIIAFSLLLCLRHNYFMNHCEMHVAIIHCIVLYAFMEYYYAYKPFGKILYVIGVALLITLCFFSHPAILFAVIFVLLYEMVDKKEGLKDFKIWFFGLIILLLFAGKALLTESNSYEGNLMGQIMNFKPLLLQIRHVYSFQFLLTRFPSLYLFAFLMGLAAFYWYYKQKNWLKLLLLTAGTGIFLLVSIIIYHEGDSEMMMERAYSMLVIFVMIPFMNDFLKQQKQQLPYTLFLVLVVIVSFAGIYNAGKFYHKRVEYVTGLLEKYKSSEKSKFILDRKELNNDIVMVPWAFSFETLMYSSLEGPEHGKTFYVAEDIKTFEYNRDDKSLFLAVPFWRDWNANDLNKKYFKLPEEQYSVVSLGD